MRSECFGIDFANYLCSGKDIDWFMVVSPSLPPSSYGFPWYLLECKFQGNSFHNKKKTFKNVRQDFLLADFCIIVFFSSTPSFQPLLITPASSTPPYQPLLINPASSTLPHQPLLINPSSSTLITSHSSSTLLVNPSSSTHPHQPLLINPSSTTPPHQSFLLDSSASTPLYCSNIILYTSHIHVAHEKCVPKIFKCGAKCAERIITRL